MAALFAASAWGLVGCTTPRHQAPVEDRGASHPMQSHPVAPPQDASVAPTPGGQSAAIDTRPSTYTVKPGDTLMRIGLDTGQSFRDLARWNNITDPNVIEVGQVLRVLPPPGEPGAPGVGAAPATSGTPVALGPAGAASTPGFKPVPPPVTRNDLHASEPRGLAASPGGVGAGASGAAVPLTGAAPAQPPARESDDDLTWAWPAAGPVIAPFDEARSKGLSISGKAGDPVLAAADGKVVYAGSGLRGYGNLVIIKHNANYLTAYAHNQVLLVKEDQLVKRGQKIAEMGSTDTDRVQLHFEIRKQGKPVDPARLLPGR